jgi:hypothetical protein
MDAETLERQINEIVSDISGGRTTPKKSGIGRMLSQLSIIDGDAYRRALELYKPVSSAFFGSSSSVRLQTKSMEDRIDSVVAYLEISESDFDGEHLSQSAWDRLLDEAVQMIEGKKKKSVPAPPVDSEPGDRDRQSYTFKGAEYGKGKLVLAVVRDFVSCRPGIDYVGLKAAFPDDLLKNYGIFKPLTDARKVSEKRKRYFLGADQVIELKDGPVAVCNQFTRENIMDFLVRARQLGCQIT